MVLPQVESVVVSPLFEVRVEMPNIEGRVEGYRDSDNNGCRDNGHDKNCWVRKKDIDE